jgi:putative tricarboxylic transport membrane protein
MRAWQIPLAPAVIGLILGPMGEQQLRRALAAAEGSWAVFVTRPISAGVLAAAVMLALLPVLLRRLRGGRHSGSLPAEAGSHNSAERRERRPFG